MAWMWRSLSVAHHGTITTRSFLTGTVSCQRAPGRAAGKNWGWTTVVRREDRVVGDADEPVQASCRCEGRETIARACFRDFAQRHSAREGRC